MNEVMTEFDKVAELRKQVAQDKQIAADLRYQQEAEARAAQGEALLNDIAREAQVSAQLEQARQVAHDAVATAKPEIKRWREDFMAWVVQGWDLVHRLRIIEAPLWKVLNDLCGWAGQWHRLMASSPEVADSGVWIAMDAALADSGAIDDVLFPLPEEGNPFANAIVGTVARYVGRIFTPSARTQQFVKRG